MPTEVRDTIVATFFGVSLGISLRMSTQRFSGTARTFSSSSSSCSWEESRGKGQRSDRIGRQ